MAFSHKISYLICGLESSCTKLISRLIAVNLLSDPQEAFSWDGNWHIEDEKYKIIHRSLPHSDKKSYFNPQWACRFNYVVICTRDYNCSLSSKMLYHQNDIEAAKVEHSRGIKILQKLINSRPTTIINYETAYLLQYNYISPILLNIGVYCKNKLEIINCNDKYIAPLQK